MNIQALVEPQPPLGSRTAVWPLLPDIRDCVAAPYSSLDLQALQSWAKYCPEPLQEVGPTHSL